MKRICCLLFFVGFFQMYAQNNIFDASRQGSLNDLISVYSKNPDIINTKNDEGYSPLILACYYGNEEIVKFLANRVKNIDQTSQYGTALMAAVVKGNNKIVELLLNKNADVNIADENGTTAIHYAVLFKNYKAVELLVNANANLKIKDNRGLCALDYVSKQDDKKLKNLLKNI